MYLKILIFSLFICLSSANLFAQNSTIDSLISATNSIPENEKSKHYEKIGDAYSIIFDYSNAIENYKKSIEISSDKKHKIGIKNKIGGIYFYMSDYDMAIEFFNEALIKSEELNDTVNLSSILNNIGIIYQKTNNIEKSIEYLNKSLEYKKLLQDSTGIANTYNNLGNAFYKKDLDKSLELYKKALEIRKKIHDTIGIGQSYNNIGLIYFQQDNNSEAIKYFESALKIKKITNDPKSIAITLNNIAEALLQLKKYSEAINYSYRSLEIAKGIEALLQIANAYTTLSSSYEGTNDYRNAYKFHKLYKTTTDSIFNYKSQNKIAQIETLYQLNKKEQEIKIDKQKIQLLEKENKLKQITQYFFIAGIILFIIIVFIVIYTLILRNKNTKQKLIISKEEKQIQELKIEKQKLKIEKQNLENKKLKDELELKKRELTSKAMMLIKNNETILNILNEINEIKQNTNTETIKKINNIITKYKISKNNFNWQEFKMLFEEVHQDFYHKLTIKYSNLTPAEIKLCAFLRLNLSTKEIAAITFKSPSTIKTTRKRLRKKLNLTTEINLISFLSKIG